MFAKLQEVILTELLDLVRSLDLVRVAARLNRVGINDAEIPKNAQTCAVPLVPLISEFAIVVGEVGRDVVKDHGESFDYGHVSGVFVHRSVTENRVLR